MCVVVLNRIYCFVLIIVIVVASETTGRLMKEWLSTAAKFTHLIPGLLLFTRINANKETSSHKMTANDTCKTAKITNR